ncbi:MAG: T9SS type A sorting domain-containing protein [Bacteroidota bacterium]
MYRIAGSLAILVCAVQVAAQPTVLWTTEEGLFEVPLDGSEPAAQHVYTKPEPQHFALDDAGGTMYWSDTVRCEGGYGRAGTVYAAAYGVDEVRPLYTTATGLGAFAVNDDTLWIAECGPAEGSRWLVNLSRDGTVRAAREVGLPIHAMVFRRDTLYALVGSEQGFQHRIDPVVYRSPAPYTSFDVLRHANGDTLRAAALDADPALPELLISEGKAVLLYDPRNGASRKIGESLRWDIGSVALDASRGWAYGMDSNGANSLYQFTLTEDTEPNVLVSESTASPGDVRVARSSGVTMWREKPQYKFRGGYLRIVGLNPVDGTPAMLVPWYRPRRLAYDAQRGEVVFTNQLSFEMDELRRGPADGAPYREQGVRLDRGTIAAGGGWTCEVWRISEERTISCQHETLEPPAALAASYPYEPIPVLTLSRSGQALYRWSRVLAPSGQWAVSKLDLTDVTSEWTLLWSTARAGEVIHIDEGSGRLWFAGMDGCFYRYELANESERLLFCIETTGSTYTPWSPHSPAFDVRSRRFAWWQTGQIVSATEFGDDMRVLASSGPVVDLVMADPDPDAVEVRAESSPAQVTWSVYPNPARTVVQFAGPAEATTLTVHDMLGRRIHQHEFTGGVIRVDIQNWPACTYIADVTTSHARRSMPFIVVR